MSAPPYNPYVAPTAKSAYVEPSLTHAPGVAIKWVYLGFSALAIAINVVLGLTQSSMPTTLTAVDGALFALFLARTSAGATWVYQAWRGVPERWRIVSPARASGLLFVPFYGIYWMFAVSVKLCDALDAVLGAASDARRAPRAAAIIAPFLNVAVVFATFVALTAHVNLNWFAVGTTFATTAGWFTFASLCDRTRRAAVEVVQRVPADAAVPPKAAPLGVGCAIGIAFAGFVAFVLFIAVWQFLQPTTPAP